jgi:general secretion pathway protein H
MCPHNRQAGFSLIEIMVIVFIVGILISVASLSIGVAGGDRALKTEADRFTALATVALDEATLQGREFGIELMTAGYRFVEYDGQTGHWAEVPGDDTLRLRQLPDEVEFELYLEGKRIVLEDDPATFEDEDDNSPSLRGKSYAPHLLIYSSGDTTPFELHLLRTFDDLAVGLRGNALGGIEIIDEDAD